MWWCERYHHDSTKCIELLILECLRRKEFFLDSPANSQSSCILSAILFCFYISFFKVNHTSRSKCFRNLAVFSHHGEIIDKSREYPSRKVLTTMWRIMGIFHKRMTWNVVSRYSPRGPLKSKLKESAFPFCSSKFRHYGRSLHCISTQS